MRYVIVDCGSVGLELARSWREAGHVVVGTTPDPHRLSQVSAVCTEAVLLAHEDADRVREVVAGADGAVLANRPQLLYTRSPRDRVLTYRRSMIATVRAAASVQRRLVLFSSVVVYGDGGTGGDGLVTEQTPPTTELYPAAQSFRAVERMVLESRESTVLRLPEVVFGHPDDPDPTTAVRALHEGTGGGPAGAELPVDGNALLFMIDYRDAAAAAEFVVAHGLAGVFNVVPDSTAPPPVEAVLHKLTADAGLPPFTFTGELKAPRRPVSSAKLRAAGFEFTHTRPIA